MNEQTNIRVGYVSPLKKICMTIGELPTSYLETMSYYEMLVWFTNYIRDTLIPTINNNAEAVSELQKLYEDLREYVNNYFDSQDWQEMVNNKLEDMLESGQLEQIIETFLQSSAIWCFDSVAEMSSSVNLVDGSYARTTGYYSANDGGGALYKITETEDLSEHQEMIGSLYGTLIVEDNLNVKQFGAYGDNTHNDTTALNTAFAFALSKGKRIFVPEGTYLINTSLQIYGSYDLDDNSVYIEGDERGSTEIKASESLENMIEIKSTGNHARRIHISNIMLNGNELANKGIYTAITMSESKLSNIKIKNCNGYGIFSENVAFYLNTLEKINVYESTYGFYIYGGTNTSINVKDCYCYNCVNAYKISGIYNVMINCCADGINTDKVFDLNLFRGTLISPGSEAYKASKMFIAGNSTNATIIGAYTWGNDEDSSSVHIDVGNGRLIFVGGYVLVDRQETDRTLPGKLFEKGSYGNITFIGTRYSKYAISNTTASFATSTSTAMMFDNINTNIRYDNKVSFLGVDGKNDGGIANPKNTTNQVPSNAIFFGLGDRIRDRADGVDLQNSGLNSKGDILLSRNPENIGGIGWIQSSDHTGSQSGVYWQSGVYYKIPVVYAETTANRMTSPVRGQMMFDRTLGKPIWYNGSNWVDSTGTQV